MFKCPSENCFSFSIAIKRAKRSARFTAAGTNVEASDKAVFSSISACSREWHRAQGTEVAELSWVLEENRPVRRVIEAMGGRPYKTYRLYRKQLA